MSKSNVIECNEISYINILDGLANKDDHYYDSKSYEEYIGQEFDVFYFPSSAYVPHNIKKGNIVTTVHDILPLKREFANQFPERTISCFEYSMSFFEENKNVILATVSLATKSDIIERYSIEESRIKVVPNGYDKTFFSPER